MAVRGRRPKPTYLKIVDGNPGKRPLNKSEPVPDGDLEVEDAPRWFEASQVQGWKFAIDNAPPGVLKRIDRSVLAIWIVAEDLHRRAAEAVAKFGLVTKSPNKGEPMQNPYLAIVNRQAQIMIKAAAELGFTPSSRSRIVAEDGNAKDKGARQKYGF